MPLSYLCQHPRISGFLKQTADDFIVEEIMPDGAVLELDKKIERKDEKGNFTHFVLQKKEWTTANAIDAIAKKLRVNFRRFNAAGTKDKIAITTQLVSAFSASKEKILGISVKDIRINGAWTAVEKIRLGDLLGNRFHIRIKSDEKNNREKVEKIYLEVGGSFPNYFGEQRFGTTRKNTHLVGEAIARGFLQDAVLHFLCDYEGEKDILSSEARKQLFETRDFESALNHFPKNLKLERMLISHLAKNPRDFANALRRLPRNILLLFIHAFQAHLFNELLSDRVAEDEIIPEAGEYFCGNDNYGFPDISQKKDNGFICMKIIGYESTPNEREKKLLEKYDIRIENFKIKSIPEISSKGTHRLAFAPLMNFSFDENVFHFTLPSGCYATVALREFIQPQNQAL